MDLLISVLGAALLGTSAFYLGYLRGKSSERVIANEAIAKLLHEHRDGLFTALMGGFRG